MSSAYPLGRMITELRIRGQQTDLTFECFAIAVSLVTPNPPISSALFSQYLRWEHAVYASNEPATRLQLQQQRTVQPPPGSLLSGHAGKLTLAPGFRLCLFAHL